MGRSISLVASHDHRKSHPEGRHVVPETIVHGPSERQLASSRTCKDPDLEKRFLGVTHCELGRRMATEWGLMPSFIDVILNHHAPDEAQHDPYLVDLVSRVERFLLAKKLALESGDAESPRTRRVGYGEFRSSRVD